MLQGLSRTAVIGIMCLQAHAWASDISFFAARRKALMEDIEGSVAVLVGAPKTRGYTGFRQDNNFYYLTGVEVPDALLLIDALQHRSLLFLPAHGGQEEQWEGQSFSAGDEVRFETGIDEVLELSRFESELNKRKGSMGNLYVPLAPQETASVSRDRALQFESHREDDPWDGRVSRSKIFVSKLREKFGSSVNIKNLSPILDEMRRVKDVQEIARLRKAANIGVQGLKEAIRTVEPGLFEYQLAAIAEFIFQWHGAMGPAFFSIVGSGPNSCLVHYHKDGRRMEAGDIVVMDIGPDYQYYASDITRSFPASGRFSEEQAKVYNIVLEAQRAAFERVRAGATFDSLEDVVREVLRRNGCEKYLTHAVAHYVGMSVHDVGESKPFEPGVVIAIEPGVYMPQNNLGIRIEDTVLVTQDGCDVLTKDAPKEITDVERLMSDRGIPRLQAIETLKGLGREAYAH